MQLLFMSARILITMNAFPNVLGVYCNNTTEILVTQIEERVAVNVLSMKAWMTKMKALFLLCGALLNHLKRKRTTKKCNYIKLYVLFWSLSNVLVSPELSAWRMNMYQKWKQRSDLSLHFHLTTFQSFTSASKVPLAILSFPSLALHSVSSPPCGVRWMWLF